MTSQRCLNLINHGAHNLVRSNLKKLSLKDRLPILEECIPHISVSAENIFFFREHFSQEIGAIMMAKGDLAKAEQLYNTAKGLK